MSIAAHYYHICSASLDPCTMSHADVARANETWLCKGCNGPRPGVEAVDVKIQESSPGKAPLTLVFGAGVGIARMDFLAEFGEERIKQYFWLGQVFLPSGQRSEGWVTFRGKNRLIVRGTKNANYRRCDECGQALYYAAGPRYLCPAPPLGVEVFESDLMGLVVTQEVFNRVGLHKWSKFDVDKLPVRSKPRDGLPALLGEQKS